MTIQQKWAAFMLALAASIVIAFLLSGCATVAQQPPQAQLAAACEQAAGLYKDASLLYATNKLPESAVAVFSQAEPVVTAACDPAHPAADPATALASLTAVLNQMALANAQAKGQ